jgi:hypothetical protein
VTVSATGTLILACHALGYMQRRNQMAAPANWSDLEQRGLIPPTPGREEAAKAALERAAARREALNATGKPAIKNK